MSIVVFLFFIGCFLLLRRGGLLAESKVRRVFVGVHLRAYTRCLPLFRLRQSLKHLETCPSVLLHRVVHIFLWRLDLLLLDLFQVHQWRFRILLAMRVIAIDRGNLIVDRIHESFLIVFTLKTDFLRKR